LRRSATFSEVGVEQDKVFAAAIASQYMLIMDMEIGRQQMFDLSEDPTEQRNTYQVGPSAGPVPFEKQLSTWLSANTELADPLPNEGGSVNPCATDQETVRK
jgi:hypothetical protein